MLPGAAFVAVVALGLAGPAMPEPKELQATHSTITANKVSLDG